MGSTRDKMEDVADVFYAVRPSIIASKPLPFAGVGVTELSAGKTDCIFGGV